MLNLGVALYLFLSSCKLGTGKKCVSAENMFPLYLAYFRENRRKGGTSRLPYLSGKMWVLGTVGRWPRQVFF